MIYKSDVVFILASILLALFIWFRDLSWMSTADDTLPILVVIPLFIWIGMPWKFSRPTTHYATPLLIGACCAFLLGIIINSTLVLAISWILLLWTWLRERLPIETVPKLKKLTVLLLLAFPWISLDFDRVGWWFRLSGSWITGKLFSLTGFTVKQEGTMLLINNMPISIEEACAGLNTLQSMLIAGMLLNFIILGESILFWLNIPLLFFIAWIANTIRIIVITAVAILISPQFAMGSFHTIGGWLIIVLMFLMCWLLFTWEESVALREGKKNE